MPYAFINGINMYYEIEGEGIPLLALPGMGSSLEIWSPEFRNAFKAKYRLLLVDYRGIGRSDAPDIEYSVPMLAQDIAELMAVLKIDKAHIMGLSLGGMIAQELALTWPERVEKLVLCATHCGTRHYIPFPHKKNKSKSELGKTYTDSIVNGMYPREFIEKNPAKIQDIIARETKFPVPPEIFARHYQAARSFDSYERLQQINCPTLIITGDQDLMVNPENSKLLARLIPQSRLEIIPGGGHGFMEQYPELVSQLVVEFLK
jgi:pimeloyl-ACP methyl ester carboxylesterase